MSSSPLEMSTPAENIYWYAVGDGKAYAIYVSDSEKAISESLRNCVNAYADNYGLMCFYLDGIHSATVVPRSGETDFYYDLVKESREKLGRAVAGGEGIVQVREDGLSRMKERFWTEEDEYVATFPDSLDDWEWDPPEWSETTYA